MRKRTSSRGGRPGRPPPPPPTSALQQLLERMKPQTTRLVYDFDESEGLRADINQFFSHEDCDQFLKTIIRDSKSANPLCLACHSFFVEPDESIPATAL